MEESKSLSKKFLKEPSIKKYLKYTWKDVEEVSLYNIIILAH